MAEAIFFERPVEKKETKTWCRSIKGVSMIVTIVGYYDGCIVQTNGPCVRVHIEGANMLLQIVPVGRNYYYKVKDTPENGVRILNTKKKRPLPYVYMANWDRTEHL